MFDGQQSSQVTGNTAPMITISSDPNTLAWIRSQFIPRTSELLHARASPSDLDAPNLLLLYYKLGRFHFDSSDSESHAFSALLLHFSEQSGLPGLGSGV
jgi:hypothetical protein